ncbi:hypothetical protein KEJ39_03310 [Candidatus Bathyarchaeota archaeon]|nr:hypothetical protein [Candidatus Bathyarchaeota archaeon]
MVSLFVISLCLANASPHSQNGFVEGQTAKLQAVILETLISVDDPDFGPYDAETGNGTIARVYHKDGVKYYESLITGPIAPAPADEYTFRYLTGIPVVDTVKHWMLYFKHTVQNLGEVTIENCVLDGWNAYVISSDGNLWRLHKYRTSSPSTLKGGEKLIANNSYQIHNAPDYRVAFYFTFKSGDVGLDSWEAPRFPIGKEILRFAGSKYSLPLMGLLRLRPGKAELTPPRIIEYLFNITNLRDEPIRLVVEHKFAQTVSWVLQLWPSAWEGRVGREEITIMPGGTWMKRMVEEYPDDRSDHAVYVYYGVEIVSEEKAPPLIGEIYQNLYGANSYLGLGEASAQLTTSGGSAEITFLLTPYVSPSSQDVMPYDYNFTITVYDSDYQRIVYGPVSKAVDQKIRKGSDLQVNYRISSEALNNQEGKYVVQVDTFRLSTKAEQPMHLARISLPFWLMLPDVAISTEKIKVRYIPAIGVENTVLVEILNRGRMDVKDFPLEIYVDGALLQSNRLNISAGSSVIVEVPWTPSRNEQTIYVKLDPENTVTESDKTNNEAKTVFTMGSLEGKKREEEIYPAIMIIISVAAAVLAFWAFRSIRSRRVIPIHDAEGATRTNRQQGLWARKSLG